MVYKGPDLFADKSSVHAESLDIVASFFDDEGVLTGAKAAYKEGYTAFAKYIAQHPEIATNKLVAAIGLNQVAAMAKLALIQKYCMTSNPLPFILALKGNAPVVKTLKLVAGILGSEILGIAFRKVQDKLTTAISNEIRMKTAQLAFQDTNITTVMDLGSDLQSFPRNLSSAVRNSFEGPAELVQNLTRPLLLNPKYNIARAAILILMQNALHSVLTEQNLKDLGNYLERALFVKQENTLELEHQALEPIKMSPGSLGSINMVINTEGYAFGHIQETAKSGGLAFMLDRLINYYEISESSNPHNESFITAILNSLKRIASDLSQASPIALLGIADTEIPILDLNQQLISQILGLENHNGAIVMSIGYGDPMDGINSLRKVIDTLKANHSSGVIRSLNSGMTFTIRNYELQKKDERTHEMKPMLHINEVHFETGKT